MSADILYSVVGSPRPYSGNDTCRKRAIFQLRLRNVNLSHVQAAFERISTFSVEAHRLNTERPGLFANVTSTEVEMTSGDIEQLLEEFKTNLKAIVGASKQQTTARLDKQDSTSTVAASRGKRHPVRTPVQRSHF